MSSLSSTTRNHVIRYRIHSGTQDSFDLVPTPFWYQDVRYSGTPCSVLFWYQTRDCVQLGTKTSVSEGASWTWIMVNILRIQLDRSIRVSSPVARDSIAHALRVMRMESTPKNSM
jgi:hypothetical protein